jgi:hypothetical protein
MKVHKLIDNKRDLEGIIHTNIFPNKLGIVADRLINMIADCGYSVGEYHTMNKLDKTLMIDYWHKYDGLPAEFPNKQYAFDDWFMNKATHPEWIRRARQKLAELQFIYIDRDVEDNAQEAGRNVRSTVKGKR